LTVWDEATYSVLMTLALLLGAARTVLRSALRSHVARYHYRANHSSRDSHRFQLPFTGHVGTHRLTGGLLQVTFAS